MIELIQEGNCGLVKAVDTFAKHPTGDFTAHACKLIEAAVRYALAERDRDLIADKSPFHSLTGRECNLLLSTVDAAVAPLSRHDWATVPRVTGDR